jgi:hypothetical protein
MDEILIGNLMLLHDVERDTTYDVWIWGNAFSLSSKHLGHRLGGVAADARRRVAQGVPHRR